MPIVFDLFGVIALPQQPAAKRRIEEAAGVDPEAFWAAYWEVRKPYDAGQPSADYWAAVAGRLGVRFNEEKVRTLTDADLESWVDVDPVMVDLIDELATGGHVLGLLSNIIEGLVPVFEAQHDRWLAHFAVRTYSCRIGVAKPDRRAYEIAAARLGAEAGECLFIDDMEANVLAAREAGMRAEVFRSPDQVRELTARTTNARRPARGGPPSRSTGRRSAR